jgi:ABC-2 type transport system permease protein
MRTVTRSFANVLAIAGKDVRVYLTTWMSYALFGFFLLMTAFFFATLVEQYQLVTLQASQQPWMLEQLNLTDVVMGNVLRNVSVFFLFLLPLLTMRLFAEERKGSTLELLMTVPVRPFEIVLGKYLAALTIMLIMLALTLVFPLLLQLYGSTPQGGASPLDWHTVATGYLGMALLGASFVAIGLFASSVTDSQIVAAITSFSILLMFFVVGYAARGKEGFWQGVLE